MERLVNSKRRLLVAAGASVPLAASGCERKVAAEQAGGQTVKTWLKRPGTPAVVIPDDFLGMHIDTGSNPRTPPANYPYDGARTVDSEDWEEMPVTHWARIERKPGEFSWREVDKWMDAQRGKTVIWTLMGCPKFYQRYPDEPWAYPYLPGGGSPPRDPQAAGNFVKALLERYGDRIRFIEVWNEPNFASKGVDPLRHRWTPEFGKPAYFTGTPADLAQLALALKKAVPAFAKVMGCAWEGQSDVSNRFNSLLRFSAAPDGAGGKGRDHVDVISVHSYTYDGNPNTIVRELVGYEACLDKAGYPKTMPRYLSEVGVERPKFWTADSPSMAHKILTIQRWCLVPAALGYKGVYLYKHALMRTLGDPARTPELASAIGDLRNRLRGREVTQGAELEDGTIWLRFGDGQEMRA